MKTISMRPIIAFVVAVALCLILSVFVSKSPYIFTLGLAIGAFLAQLTTFKSGLLFGLIMAIPLSLDLVLSDSIAGINNNLISESLNIILLVGFGGIYTGIIVWLINRLKQGKVFFT